jgi:competence protein ComEC
MAGFDRKIFFLSPLTLIAAVLACAGSSPPELVWSMINVNYSNQQADAHLIQIHGGKTILIDAGDRTTAETGLIPFLEDHGVTAIDTVFISHPHKDHYGGVEYLLKHNIQIREIYFNIPDRQVCDHERPWGCDYTDVLNVHEKLRQQGIPIRVARAGDTFDLGKDTRVSIIYAFDGVHTPVGKTDINDMSLVMMLYHKKYKFLFTGDLNRKIGAYLAETSESLSADVLKVPHHGTESTVPDEFFEKVSPSYALVPAPQTLWQSKRSKRIRDWFSAHNIPVWVSGMDGDVFVEAQRCKSLQVRSAKLSD